MEGPILVAWPKSIYIYSKAYVQEQPLGPMFSLVPSYPCLLPRELCWAPERPRVQCSAYSLPCPLTPSQPVLALPGGQGAGLHMESQGYAGSPEEGPLGLMGDGGIQSHQVDMPLFTAGWRRKRRRCASGERNSTWTLLRYTSRERDMDPTKAGIGVATGGGHGPHQGAQMTEGRKLPSGHLFS